jgi:hydroxyacylglutathione hydrolase
MMYLVRGDARAVLIDTGFGIGDLKTFVEQLTSLPVTVLLTHGHLDHAFGAGWFSDVRLSSLDHRVLDQHRELIRPVHAEASADGFAVVNQPDLSFLGELTDGEHFDLGGVHIETLAAPGHTPGSMAFLIPQERILLTGDAANQYTFLFLPESSSVSDYRASLSRLRARTEGSYDRVLVSHGSGDAQPTLLADLDLLCSRILRGEDDAAPFEFMQMRGLMARRTGGVTPEPDERANLIYRSAPAATLTPA